MATKRTRGVRTPVFLAAALVSALMLHASALPGDGSSSSASQVPDVGGEVGAEPISTAAAAALKLAETAGAKTSVTPQAEVRPGADTLSATPSRPSVVALAAGYPEQASVTVANVAFTAPVDCGGYLCQVRLDIHVPSGPGPYPTLVLLRGGPGGLGARGYLNTFATSLAESGILVFSADYRDSPVVGGGYPQAFADASCAVRFAREQAAKYGGDNSTITVGGHSLGGWVGSVIALGSREFDGGCLASGEGRPDAFVGMSGCYDITSSSVSLEMSVFFAGATPAAVAASDPMKIALGRPIPVRFVAGAADGSVYPGASVMLNDMLLKRGWNTSLVMVPGGSHSSILWTDYKGGSFGAIFTAISTARSLVNATDPVKGSAGY